MNRICFVTGGARSGKSTFALSLAEGYEEKIFLATAEPFDTEMHERIERHRLERADAFTTLEEPLELGRVLRHLPSATGLVLVDCLTVWTGNLLYYSNQHGQAGMERLIAEFLSVLEEPPCPLILVTNEIGMGIVPDNPLSRAFRDLAGTINQRAAALSTEAYLLCSGLPIRLR